MSLHLNPGDADAFTRREFIGRSALFASAALSVPAFIQSSALGLTQAAPGLSSIPGIDEDRVLLVIQLSGGNDGLNTVIPFRDDSYRRVRPTIAIPSSRVHALSRNGRGGAGDMGLHPAMSGLKSLYDDGLCSIVQSVGYPNPNRSHFASMDIWHTADTTGTGDGWLGRYYDAQCCGYGKGESGTAEDESGSDPEASMEPAISMGKSVPLALQGRTVMPVSFESPDLFRWTGERRSNALNEAYQQIIQDRAAAHDEDHPEAEFLVRTALDARVSSEVIREAVSEEPLVRYPNSAFAKQLSMIGSMIRAGMKTRVYYASLGSFDTHAGQGGEQGQHARLLSTLSEGVRAFYNDLKAQGNDQRVLSVCFSEFGRRVGQNASNGTDHGTAAPMFMFGPMTKPGVHGPNPSLTDLDDGDLKYRIDFRSVYAEVLDEWLQAPSKDILGDRYRHLGILDT